MKKSAGLILYRKSGESIEVLLVHPGGPFWAKKDAGVWSIPKGLVDGDEDDLVAAKREFAEELGMAAPGVDWWELGSVKYGDKEVVAWAGEADLDVGAIKSNLIEIDWPLRTGRKLEIPEVDRAEWFSLGVAKEKLVKGQVEFVAMLADMVGASVE